MAVGQSKYNKTLHKKCSFMSFFMLKNSNLSVITFVLCFIYLMVLLYFSACAADLILLWLYAIKDKSIHTCSKID